MTLEEALARIAELEADRDKWKALSRKNQKLARTIARERDDLKLRLDHAAHRG